MPADLLEGVAALLDRVEALVDGGAVLERDPGYLAFGAIPMFSCVR